MHWAPGLVYRVPGWVLLAAGASRYAAVAVAGPGAADAGSDVLRRSSRMPHAVEWGLDGFEKQLHSLLKIDVPFQCYSYSIFVCAEPELPVCSILFHNHF